VAGLEEPQRTISLLAFFFCRVLFFPVIVLKSEPSLYQAIRFPQHPEACIAPKDPTVAKDNRRRLGEVAVTQAEAEAACAHWAEEQKDLCIFDVVAVDDLEIAQAGAY